MTPKRAVSVRLFFAAQNRHLPVFVRQKAAAHTDCGKCAKLPAKLSFTSPCEADCLYVFFKIVHFCVSADCCVLHVSASFFSICCPATLRHSDVLTIIRFFACVKRLFSFCSIVQKPVIIFVTFSQGFRLLLKVIHRFSYFSDDFPLLHIFIHYSILTLHDAPPESASACKNNRPPCKSQSPPT